MDATCTKVLSIHIDALLPPTSAELDLPHSAQVAAILGIGLVYQGTAQRRMAEVLLSEIGKSFVSSVFEISRENRVFSFLYPLVSSFTGECLLAQEPMSRSLQLPY